MSRSLLKVAPSTVAASRIRVLVGFDGCLNPPDSHLENSCACPVTTLADAAKTQEKPTRITLIVAHHPLLRVVGHRVLNDPRGSHTCPTLSSISVPLGLSHGNHSSQLDGATAGAKDGKKLARNASLLYCWLTQNKRAFPILERGMVGVDEQNHYRIWQNILINRHPTTCSNRISTLQVTSYFINYISSRK